MANIKLTGNTWDASGVYDDVQGKTQKQVNSDLKTAINVVNSTITKQKLIVTNGIDTTINGITVKRIGDTTIRISGAVTTTTSAAHFFFIFNGNNSYLQGNNKTPTEYTLPAGTYTIRFSAASEGSMYSIGYILKGDTTTTRTYLNDGDVFTVDDEISFFVRTATSFSIPDGENIEISIYDGSHSDYPLTEHDFANDLYAREKISEMAEDSKIPDYYTEYIATKANTVNAVLGGGDLTAQAPEDVDQFIFFTDYHYDPNEYKAVVGHGECNTKHSPALMKYLLTHTGVNKIIFSGDIATSYSNSRNQQFLLDCLTDFKRTFSFAWQDVFSVNGNHEYNTQSVLSYGKLSQMLRGQQDRFVAGYDSFGDYVLEVKSKSLWFIFINTQNNIWESNNQINDNQIKFLFEKLTEIPDGYSAIVVTHSMLSYSGELADWNWSLTSAGEKISNGFTAFFNRTTHTFSDDTFDFTNVNAEIVCVLSGHTHMDTHIVMPCGVPVIMTTSDTARKRNAYYDSSSGEWVRANIYVGTYREQAFDVVTINKKTHKIYMTRIGDEGVDPITLLTKADGDREFSYPTAIT